jgi:hypothetical protein
MNRTAGCPIVIGVYVCACAICSQCLYFQITQIKIRWCLTDGLCYHVEFDYVNCCACLLPLGRRDREGRERVREWWWYLCHQVRQEVAVVCAQEAAVVAVDHGSQDEACARACV